MGNTKTASKTLSIKVPAQLSARLSNLARRRRVPVSVVVREALEQIGEANTGSFGELAKEFCGRLSGPADLSTNVEHLKGYGS
jgi:predicted DNA-binding protein